MKLYSSVLSRVIACSTVVGLSGLRLDGMISEKDVSSSGESRFGVRNFVYRSATSERMTLNSRIIALLQRITRIAGVSGPVSGVVRG